MNFFASIHSLSSLHLKGITRLCTFCTPKRPNVEAFCEALNDWATPQQNCKPCLQSFLSIGRLFYPSSPHIYKAMDTKCEIVRRSSIILRQYVYNNHVSHVKTILFRSRIFPNTKETLAIRSDNGRRLLKTPHVRRTSRIRRTTRT